MATPADSTPAGFVAPSESTGFDLGEYSATVPDRFDYGTTGPSAAASFATGLPIDAAPAAGADVAPRSQQGGEDSKAARESSIGLAQTIVSNDAGNWLGTITAADANGHGILLARAGAPTDDGRLPMAVVRNSAAPDTWRQVDDGMGVKFDSAPPLAYGGILYDSPVVGGFASPGGNTPALPDQELQLLNTYRVPPTPWDEYNYIGGPFDA